VSPRDAAGTVGTAGVYRLLGGALALAATDPTRWTADAVPVLTRLVCVLLATLWAAAPPARRPVTSSHRLPVLVSRHRNTLFVIVATAVAALGNPPVWLAAVDCALLLAYLALVDAAACGPVGVRQLRRTGTTLSAAAATAAVLVCAQAPVGSASPWGRVIAALGITAAAACVGAVLWLRQTVRRGA
jgi:hypothetical protein